MTINEISEEFFDMKRSEVRVSTLSSYMTHIAGVPIDEIAKVHLQSFVYRLLETVGIPRKKFHALRHTFASMMITNGADIVTTSKLLGHSDVSTTLNVYSHSNEEKKREAVQMIGKKLKLLSI